MSEYIRYDSGYRRNFNSSIQVCTNSICYCGCCKKPIETECESGWMFPSGKCVLFPSNRNVSLS